MKSLRKCKQREPKDLVAGVEGPQGGGQEGSGVHMLIRVSN